MRFSTIFSILATSAMAFAGVIPKMVVKRAATDVQSAFTSLSGNCDPIISKFDSCQDDECSSELVNELASAIAPCDATIKPLSCDAANDGVANAASDFATKIANGLDSLKNKCGSKCPKLSTALPKVDSALSSCLGTASNVCSGLEPLLSPKLNNAAGPLNDLGFSSTRNAAGLSSVPASN